MIREWLSLAESLGFHTAVPLEPSLLAPRRDVRDQCAADRCRGYGKNWMCPPSCGSLEECGARLRAFSRGILVQTVGKTEKLIDTRAYRRIEAEHLKRFYDLCACVRERYPDALCLGAGGCRVCPSCAWPEPCRAPHLACASMEAYGLFVMEVCRSCGAAYHHGERTVTYTSCILLPENPAEKEGQD